VLVNAMGPCTLRAVTHLDVSRTQCEHAARVMANVLGG
jgi:threonine aldolase